MILTLSDPTIPEQDEIQKYPSLEDILSNPTDGFITTSWLMMMRVAVADFTNLEFQDSEVYILVDLPYGKKAIGTKWVYRNKKDERGVVVRNKARLVAQGHRQEEVYQMDVKSAFLMAKNDELSMCSTTQVTQRPPINVMSSRILLVIKGKTQTGLRNPQQECFNFLAGTYFLARQKPDHCGTSTTEARIVAAASCLKVLDGNHGGQSSSDKSISGNEGDMTLQSVYDLYISCGTHVLGSSQGNSTLEGTNQEAQEASQTCYHTPQSMDEECLIEAKIGRKEILNEKLDAKGSQPSESETQNSDFDTCKSDCSVETHESLPDPTVNEPKVVNKPKVWFDAPIIEEYESDSEDEHVSQPTKEQEQPSFASTNKQVKTLRETVKNQFTHSKNPTVDKKGLVYGFTARACFVCGSLSHLIRDCDFHEKRKAKQAELNNSMRMKSTVLTRTGKIPVNTARASGTNNDYPHRALKHKGIVDSGCSRHMTGNKAYLAEYQDFNGGPVAFRGSKWYITGKGKIKTRKLDFADVCFVKELQQFNLFSVSQICNKKNKVLFTDSECLVLSPEFKLPDENQVLLRIPRQNNMYSFNLENIVPSGGLACLIAKATIDESNKWHRRLGHVNFKNLNKLVKGNLVRGLPSKIFQNDHTCVACQKGKQHKASCKAKSVSSISHSLQLLHMDLFGPTSVRSLNHKTYCLVITDDFSRFSWVFFLRTKDETSGILKDFIRQIENQLNQKVKTIRCDNGTEFKNRDFIEFCGSKGIKREYSNARTPQQNGVAERKNRTLIEAARTMLADSFLPNTFWAEAVSTACYVLNRVLVTKPHNKTPYELVTGKIPIISYIRPFGCHVTILNTIDHLGKFDGKSDEGFLVGYSLQSKAFRVYNLETKRVEENLHITFLENKPNVAGKGPTWLFDLDYLTDSMNYQPVRSENKANKHAGPQEANHNAGIQDNIDAGDSEKEDTSAQDYFVLPIWSSYYSTVKRSIAKDAGEAPNKRPDLKTDEKLVDKEDQVFLDELERLKRQEKDANDAVEALRKEFARET
ncbi:putative ribonuclease H-like domain-containing protein [Tanacetum coccineum]